jgi:hypothetical protein
MTRVILDTGPLVAVLDRIFTLDEDFLVYRKNRRQRIPVLMPAR